MLNTLDFFLDSHYYAFVDGAISPPSSFTKECYMRPSFSTIRQLVSSFSTFPEWKWIFRLEDMGVLEAIYDNNVSGLASYGWDITSANGISIVTLVTQFSGKSLFITVMHCSDTDTITVTFTGRGKSLTIVADGDKSHSNMIIDHTEVDQS